MPQRRPTAPWLHMKESLYMARGASIAGFGYVTACGELSSRQVFGVCFQTAPYSLANSGRNQHAQINHLLRCDRTCGYSSINFNRGFRYRVGPNRSAASAAAV